MKNTCLNGGVCINIDESRSQCKCKDDYKGSSCEISSLAQTNDDEGFKGYKLYILIMLIIIFAIIIVIIIVMSLAISQKKAKIKRERAFNLSAFNQSTIFSDGKSSGKF